jgi:L-ascorbate metabolism protein UlaG (beta-lactamase superfamily)
VVRNIEAILVTHTHSDHWDVTASRVLRHDLPLFGQPEDQGKFRAEGFTQAQPVNGSVRWNGIQITRTGGQHGTGEIAKAMAPVSGFVLRAPGEPVLYIAGDTIWCEEVRTTVDTYRPEIMVVNAGAARFLEGDPITMTATDVIAVCQAAPWARVVAVHMEAINHCMLLRSDLAFQLDAAHLSDQVTIPEDGGWVAR